MILVLQAAAAVHVGVDNFDVVSHVARLVEGMAPCKPFALLNYGEWLLLVKELLDEKGLV